MKKISFKPILFSTLGIVSIAVIAANKKNEFGLPPPSLDLAQLEKYQRFMETRPELKLRDHGRTPAQAKADCREVPIGNVDLQYGPVADMNEGEHGDGENYLRKELYTPSDKGAQWIFKTKRDEAGDTKEYSFKQLGSEERTAKIIQIKDGYVRPLDNTEYFVVSESVPLSTGEDAAYGHRVTLRPYGAPATVAAKYECVTLPASIPNRKQSMSARVEVRNGQPSVLCTASDYDEKTKVTTEYAWQPGSDQVDLSVATGENQTLFRSLEHNAWFLFATDAKQTLSISEVSAATGYKPVFVASIPQWGKEVYLTPQRFENGLLGLTRSAPEGEEGGTIFLFDPKAKAVLQPALAYQGYQQGISFSPSGKMLFSNTTGFHLYQRTGNSLKELPVKSTLYTGTDAGNADGVVTEAADVAALPYGGARWLNDTTFFAFPEIPEETKNTLVRRARMRVYRVNGATITHQPIKGTERASGGYMSELNPEEFIVWTGSNPRLLNVKTYKVRPKTFISRFRNTAILGNGYLSDYDSGVVNQNQVCVKWNDVKGGGANDAIAIEVLKDTKSFCTRTMTGQSRWNKIPGATDANPVLGKDTLDALKLRFQKPAGIDLARDVKTLLYLFDNRGANLAEADPKTAALILSTVLSKSQLLYEFLLKQFVRTQANVRNIPVATLATCWSAAEREAVKNAANEYFNSLFTRGDVYGKDSTTDQVLYYNAAILKPALYLPPVMKDGKKDTTEADDAADKAATKLAEKTRNNPIFSQVFFSKLYKFAYQYVAPFYGAEASAKIDYTGVRLTGKESNGDASLPKSPNINGVVMSTHKFTAQAIDAAGKPAGPATNSRASGYGFHYLNTGLIALKPTDVTKPTPIPLPAMLANVRITRSVAKGGVEVPETYTAKMSVSYMPKAKVVPDERSFQTAASQTGPDKSLTGLLMFGVHLGDEDYIHGEYKAFYQERGYKFTKETDDPNILATVTELIKTDKVDYLVKEAHSDGDEKNVFQLYQNVKISHGVKTKGGLKEDVYLTRPAPASSDEKGVLWANADFGAAIKARKLPFTYLNTSCWSVGKAPFEIEQAGSTKFFDIASTTMVDTFYNQEDSIVYQLVRGVLDSQDFQKVHDTYLVLNAENKAKVNNYFIFPGSAEYTEQIEAKLGIPVDLSVKVFDKTGKEIAIGDVH